MAVLCDIMSRSFLLACTFLYAAGRMNSERKHHGAGNYLCCKKKSGVILLLVLVHASGCFCVMYVAEAVATTVIG